MTNIIYNIAKEGVKMLDLQVNQVRKITDFEPEIAIVLGSGLGDFANKIDVDCIIKYSQIDGMPVSTAPTHIGQFVFGTIGNKKVVLMQGRIHLYEGYTPQEAIMPIRLLKSLGVKTIILTNASGGINKEFSVGDFMVINDHISSFVPSPLIGKNDDEIGTRFPDMSSVYDKEYQKLLIKVANDNNISVKKGVYVQLTGPQFETPAEIKMLSTIGCDAVGMSTVIEAIAAKHCGLKVAGISLIANYACGIIDRELTSDEVNETANAVSTKFETLIKEFIKAI